MDIHCGPCQASMNRNSLCPYPKEKQPADCPLKRCVDEHATILRAEDITGKALAIANSCYDVVVVALAKKNKSQVDDGIKRVKAAAKEARDTADDCLDSELAQVNAARAEKLARDTAELVES